MTLVGGPTVLIEYGGSRLLTDPTFDPPGCYPGAPCGFEKTTGPALSIAQVGRLDAVLLSHDQHIDSLDRSGREFLRSVPTVYTTKAGAGRLGGAARGLSPFESCTLRPAAGPEILITATPARHGPVGVEALSGDVIGFALGRSRPGDLLYVTGATVWFDGAAEVSHRFSPEVVLMFTGAAEPHGRFRMTMGSEDALEAAHAFPKAALAAAQNEGWAHLRETQTQLATAFGAFGLADRLKPFERGRPLSFPLPPRPRAHARVA
jgi:L-ascorbate metabolism protein UlaG (beta-lactamase superfamily)